MIQKYEVDDLRHTYTLPLNSDFLSVMVNPRKFNIGLYFAVDPEEKEVETRTFWFVAVGRTIPSDAKYLGSIVKEGLNYHLFELLNRHLKKIL